MVKLIPEPVARIEVYFVEQSEKAEIELTDLQQLQRIVNFDEWEQIESELSQN
ncbi:MAG: hypothetical protein ACFFDT_00330 [Candidatus Hodarchaeota archaeon]